MTIMSGSFKELINWQELTKSSGENCFLIYAGNENQDRTDGKVIAWNNIKEIFSSAQ
jgi:hypothetical protein